MDANTVKVKIPKQVRWIGAWIRQAIESILGKKHVDVFSTHYYVHIGVSVNNRRFLMKYYDGKLRYYMCNDSPVSITIGPDGCMISYPRIGACDAVAAYIELANPEAAEQLKKVITRGL